MSGARGRGRERDGARNKSARGHFGLSEPAISRGRAGKGESICASAGRAGGRALRPAHTGCASPASPPARRPPASGPRADRADGATRRSTWDKGGWGIEGSLSHRRCRAARWGKGGRGRGSGGQTDVHFPQPRGAGGTRCREPRRTRRARIPPRPSICAFPSLVTRAPGLAPAVWTHEELLPQAHLVEGLDDLSVVGHNDAICADLDAIRRRGCCEKGGRERARRGVKNALHLHKTGPQQRAPPLIHAPAAGADSLMMTESGERVGRELESWESWGKGEIVLFERAIFQNSSPIVPSSLRASSHAALHSGSLSLGPEHPNYSSVGRSCAVSVAARSGFSPSAPTPNKYNMAMILKHFAAAAAPYHANKKRCVAFPRAQLAAATRVAIARLLSSQTHVPPPSPPKNLPGTAARRPRPASPTAAAACTWGTSPS